MARPAFHVETAAGTATGTLRKFNKAARLAELLLIRGFAGL